MKSIYREVIEEVAPDLDPRHVEAWMRLEYGTLDHLDKSRFKQEAAGLRTVLKTGEMTQTEAENLAKSYNL